MHISSNFVDDRKRVLKIEEICDYLSNTDVIENQSQRIKIMEKYIDTILNKVYNINKNEIVRENSLENNRDSRVLQSYSDIEKSIIDNIINGTQINNTIIEQCVEILNDKRKSNLSQNHKKGSGGLIGFKDDATAILYKQLTQLSSKISKSDFDKAVQGIVEAHNLHYTEGVREDNVK